MAIMTTGTGNKESGQENNYGITFSVIDGDDCINNPCGGGATCVDDHFNFTCVCPEGKHGETCQCESTFSENLHIEKISN